MSNMLAEAIIDAGALRTAALKNAENVVIEKYSHEVRKTLEQILEQEDVDLGAAPDLGLEPDIPTGDFDDELAPAGPEEEVVEGDDVALAATDGLADLGGKNLSQFPAEGENVEISIDLGALQEAVKQLAESEEVEIDEQALVDVLAEVEEEADDNPEDPQGAGEMADEPGSAGEAEAAAAQTAAQGEEDKESGYGGTDEGIERLVDAIMEKLAVDMGAEISGWAGRPTSQLKHEQEKELAGAQSDDVKEDLEDLNKAQEELVAENNQLKEQNDQYKQTTKELREGLQDVNLSNARLLYTNRVLRNTSLNERQKDKIVEAISSAGSVTEARTIYDTLQSTVEAAPKRGPQSLSEAIGRRSSVIRATRQESTASDPFQDRMKKLAGIK